MYGFQCEASGGQNDELSQILATTPGATYNIDFYTYGLDFGGGITLESVVSGGVHADSLPFGATNDLLVKFGNDTVFSKSFLAIIPIPNTA